jgi:uncharacterized membrane protein YdcZ (DUF606 family)
MQNFIWPALLTIGAGISVLIQQALNANLRAELNSAAWSGFTSYLLGVVCMLALAVVLRDPAPVMGLERPETRRRCLHCNLGDRPDDRRTRRRSFWMAWDS